MKILLRVAMFVATIGCFLLLVSCSSVKNARENNYDLWMDALKGGNGPVYYVGSEGTNAYFRVGSLFYSYYKVPEADTHLPKTFPLSKGEPYRITFSMIPE
jgi:hypothetical protein